MRCRQCWTWQCWHLVLLTQTKCMSLLQCHFCPYSGAINSVLLTHCTGLSVIRRCLPCQMMMWLGIVQRTLGLQSITLQRITRLWVLSAQQHWWYCAAFLISLCHWVTEEITGQILSPNVQLGISGMNQKYRLRISCWTEKCVCVCEGLRAHTRLWKLH